MNLAKFCELEYSALRAEIEAAKERSFRIYGIGGTIIPALVALSHKFDIFLATLFLPILVIGASFLYFAENRAIERCGEYINEQIEAKLPCSDNEEGRADRSPFLGWETWLMQSGHTNAKKYFLDGFYIIFLAY